MKNVFLEETFNFRKTIILDIANNHFGEVKHGIDIVNSINTSSPYKI